MTDLLRYTGFPINLAKIFLLCSIVLQPVFWGCELQAVGQDLGAQCLPPQLEGGGGEGHPYRPHLPQHGLQGSHFIHHIVVNSSLKEDGAVLVDMSLFTKPTITCNMDFSFFPFDVQRCLLKIQVFKRNLRKTFLMLQASQSRDRLDLKMLSGLNIHYGASSVVNRKLRNCPK